MDKVLFHGEPLPKGLLHKALADLDIRVCTTKRELANNIIHEEDVVGVIINRHVITDEYLELFHSMAGHFPLIKLGIITDSLLMTDEKSWKQFPGYTDEDQLAEDLHAFIFSDAIRNRRQYNRIEWILKGEITTEGETREYEIHSISAGGAFFKHEGGILSPGVTGDLKIRFQNALLKCRCRVLEARNASSNLPFGFPVHFEGLTDESKRILDNIIRDALVKLLMAPEEEPEIPTLDGDSLTPDFEMVL